jgi:hypothetical protein
MAMPTPALSNINGTTANGFFIADVAGVSNADTLALENDAGSLKLFKIDGTTLATMQVGLPTNNDDVATKSYVDSAPVANATEQVVAVPLAFNSAGTVNSTYALPNNARVTKVTVVVSTPFDGTAPTVSVGYSGQATKFMTTTDSLLTQGGSFTKEQWTAQNAGTAQTVLLTYVADSSTAGAATVLVWYVIQARG